MSINVLYSVLIVDIRITAKLSYIYPILNREPLVELYDNKIISTFNFQQEKLDILKYCYINFTSLPCRLHLPDCGHHHREILHCLPSLLYGERFVFASCRLFVTDGRTYSKLIKSSQFSMIHAQTFTTTQVFDFSSSLNSARST